MRKSVSSITYLAAVSILTFLFWNTATLAFQQESLKLNKIEVVFPDKALPGASKIKAYTGQWKQLVLENQQWKQSATINESLKSVDDLHWEHVQTSISGNNRASMKRTLRKSDLFTIEMNQALPGGEGQPEALAVFYGNKQIKRQIIMPGHKVTDQQVALPFDGYDGFIFGLALAGLMLEDGKTFRIPAVMPNFMNGYWVDVSIKDGGLVTTTSGAKRAVWFADASWLNLHDGDTYLPGPNGSGGRYVIFKKPMKGQPLVYRYKTDTVDIILE